MFIRTPLKIKRIITTIRYSILKLAVKNKVESSWQTKKNAAGFEFLRRSPSQGLCTGRWRKARVGGDLLCLADGLLYFGLIDLDEELHQEVGGCLRGVGIMEGEMQLGLLQGRDHLLRVILLYAA